MNTSHLISIAIAASLAVTSQAPTQVLQSSEDEGVSQVRITKLPGGRQLVTVDGMLKCVVPEGMNVRWDHMSRPSTPLPKANEQTIGVRIREASSFFSPYMDATFNVNGKDTSRYYPGNDVTTLPACHESKLVFPEGDSVVFPCDFHSYTPGTDAAFFVVKKFFMTNVDSTTYRRTIASFVRSYGEPTDLLITFGGWGSFPSKWLILSYKYLNKNKGLSQRPHLTVWAFGCSDDYLLPNDSTHPNELTTFVAGMTNCISYNDSANSTFRYDGVIAGVWEASDDHTTTDVTKQPIIVYSLATPVNDTIMTRPAGLAISVDDQSYSTPHIFSWYPGISYAVAADQIETVGDSVRYSFDRWSDAGTSYHIVTALESGTTYTAYFSVLSYHIVASCDSACGWTGGTAYELPGWQWTVTATPHAGFRFIKWTEHGDSVSNEASYSFLVSRPRTLFAVFSPSTGMSELPTEMPSAFCLAQNYPNPFNPSTSIR